MAKKAARSANSNGRRRRITTKGARRRESASGTNARDTPPSSPRRQFLDVLTKEFPTTLKVMRAYPQHRASFRPHDRSQPAKRLMWTFVVEQALILKALNGDLTMPPGFPTEPDTIEEVISAYESGVADVVAALEKTPDARLTKTVQFSLTPRRLDDVPVIDIMWLMLMDSIHHRGQLSVYVRLAGGRVPSIYGPSADEPWV
jgi:uncharacterized damage-inducible protein DinB